MEKKYNYCAFCDKYQNITQCPMYYTNGYCEKFNPNSWDFAESAIFEMLVAEILANKIISINDNGKVKYITKCYSCTYERNKCAMCRLKAARIIAEDKIDEMIKNQQRMF